MKYKTLPYLTANDIKKAEKFITKLQDNYNHVDSIAITGGTVTIEYKK